jgi:hypothetical protein
MTLGTVIVGSIAIYAAVHTNNRRLGADIFLRYSDRISDLRRSLPISAFVEQEVSSNVEKTPEERRAAHEVIYSIFELYELKVYGFLPHAIWKIREPDIEALLSLPFFQHELATFENRFARHPRFARWLDQVRRSKAYTPPTRMVNLELSRSAAQSAGPRIEPWYTAQSSETRN